MGNLNFENFLREEFEKMHKGRRLGRHQLRGTYQSPQIAALWNQHRKTAQVMLDALMKAKEGAGVESLLYEWMK